MTPTPGLHLPLPTLPLHGDSGVALVLALRAQHAHARVVAPAEELQEPPVAPAHPPLQHRHGLHQLVGPEGGNPQVRLQVTVAVRGQAGQAGLGGLRALPRARVAGYGRACGRPGLRRGAAPRPQADPLGHLFGEGVVAELRASVEGGAAPGAAEAGAGALPVGRDAGEAEAVAAGDGDGLTEDVLTHGAAELHL